MSNVPGCMVDGDPASPLLVIGMAPGREELLADKPFVGGSGKLLWKQLLKKGRISRADCYIVNTIGEWPEGIDGNPTQAQYSKFWEQFDEAVRLSKARCALVLGRAAMWRLTGIGGEGSPKPYSEGIEEWRGYLIDRSEAQPLRRTIERATEYKTNVRCKCYKDEAATAKCKKCGGTGWARRKGDPRTEKSRTFVPAPWPESVKWVVPALHPAAILRTGLTTLPTLASDTGRIGRAIDGSLEVWEPKWHDGIPSSMSVYGGSPIVVDIETGGVGNDIITRIGANDSNQVWTALWDSQSREALRWTLRAAQRGPTVAFNIGFDAPRLELHGVPLPEPWWDVMLAAALCQPDLKKSLNYTTSLYMDSRRWKHLSESYPAKYNALDVAATLQLYHILRAELVRTGQLDLFEKRMMPTVPVFVEMTRRGIKVDQHRRADWIIELDERRTIALETWNQIAPGMKSSGSRLTDWMFGQLGLPRQYHKHGGITSEMSGLRKMLMYEALTQRQRDVLNTLLELRSIEKELRTYAAVEISEDGCIHPGFLPAGKDTDSFGKGIAGTGRPSSSNPNIQNQPPSARGMYIPHDKSMLLIEADYSQIEARIIAHLSGDDELWAAIKEGLHTSNARHLGVDKTRAKNGFYGWAYGAGKRTLHNTFVSKGYDIPESECEALLRGFDRRFAKASAWRQAIAAEVTSKFYLTNVFGRRRYFMGGGRDVPAALDYNPQSNAADIGWSVIRPLRDALKPLGSYLLAWNHDAALGETDRSKVAETAAAMREVMEQPWPELDGLRIPVEVKTGESWNLMEPLHV